MEQRRFSLQRMGFFCIVFLALLGLFSISLPLNVQAGGSVRYAAPVAQGSGDCSSWANACTLQTALSQAVSEDEIWVKMGVHYPGLAGNRSATFALQNGVALYGGFAGTETSRDQRNWTTNKTILSGDIDGNDTNTDGNFIAETWNDIQGNNAFHVVTGNGLDNTAVLDGFVITAGTANGSNPDDSGGGMYNINSSPTLTNITFSGNVAYDGGGLKNYNNSHPKLTQITFQGNYAEYGGGMDNGSNCSPTLTHVIFRGNSAINSGGGIATTSGPALVNVIFHSNSAGVNGGGMYTYNLSYPTLINVTFSGNSATSAGGGMYCDNGQHLFNPTLTNVILWGDSAPSGAEIYTNNCNPSVTYSNIQGGYGGTGNINADPRFVDAAAGNLRLQLTSPAIDAGKNAAVPSGVTTDLDGNLRFVDVPAVPNSGDGTPPIVDMGAYEARPILYAAPAAQGNGNCSAWSDACTLQNALAQAINGHEIWVKQGLHLPGAARTDTFSLKNGVTLYGGFAGTETSRSQRNWTTNKTILSGDIDGNDTNSDANFIAETTADIVGSNAYHVVSGSGTDSTAVLDGFVITAGQANGSYPHERGGGMVVIAGSPTLIRILFSGNLAASFGGGMSGNGSPNLSYITFSGNSATDGGGMLIYNSSNVTLTQVTLRNNSASSEGGGLYNALSTNSVLTNVTFYANSASSGGGISNALSSSLTLTNVTFYANSASSTGGGIANSNSNLTLTNVTFYANSASSTGGGIANSYSSLTLTNAILWGNTAPSAAGISNVGSTPLISYSDIQGGYAGTGNIEADPTFVDAANGNLRLQLTSPAIDAGNNAAVPASITTDLDGNPRFMNIPTVPDSGNGTPPIVDMGAFESWPIFYAAPTAQGNGNCFSWSDACTLQTALTQATKRQEIWVKTGVHKPGSERTDAFTLKNGVEIYGGFNGTETSRDQRNWTTNKTILSGDIDNNDTNTDGNAIAETTADIVGDNAYHVVASSTDNTAVLDGFVITAGSADDTFYEYKYSGGGMINYFGSPTLKNVFFSGNFAYYGGGMYSKESSPTLINVIFSGNAASFGGAMFNYISSPTLTNVTFSGNYANGYGGAMYNSAYSNPTLINVTFSGNKAKDRGGAMFNHGNTPTLTNVIMWGDSAPDGAEIYNSYSAPIVSYSDIQGGYSGTGNINADPLFVDADGPDNVVGTADDNLRLGFGSPAIDAGYNNAVPAGITTDLDGLPRKADGNGDGYSTVDMGAYEAGQMKCNVTQGNTYTFGDQSGVSVQVVTVANLACLYVDEMGLNHPSATPGIQSGRYWLIRGLQSDKVTDASGFSVNLTLPTTFTPDDNDKLCRYPGNLGGSGWDCAANSHTANTITRNGVSAFSDWAVGNNVGPTAVRLTSFQASSSPSLLFWLLPAALAIAMFFTNKRLAKP